MKRLMLAVLLISIGNGPGRAYEYNGPSPTPYKIYNVKFLNFNQVFHSVRSGAFVDQHFDSHVGIYTTLLGFHDSKGLELVDINGGYLKDLESSKGSGLAEIGIRFDNLLSLALSSEWGQSHVSTTLLPSLEFGPFLALAPHKQDGALKLNTLFGFGLAIGF